GDDGFGPVVIEFLLTHYHLPTHVLALKAGTSLGEILFELAFTAHRPRRLIIVDAVDCPDRQPGEVFTLPVADLPAGKIAAFSSHQFPGGNVLQELRNYTGMEITILVAQVQNLPGTVKPGLSEPVQAAVPVAAQWLWLAIAAE
ncbi:MAG: hydrogenase maturation protease, partial [Deltaproteobacteria bacterium]|nr:hydrogenase maturation protease [Deltaproteobacteria bacterium]